MEGGEPLKGVGPKTPKILQKNVTGGGSEEQYSLDGTYSMNIDQENTSHGLNAE